MTIIKRIIICLLFIILSCNIVFARRESARDKACFSNIRVILGALEMYNMDHETMLEEVNPDIIEKLVETGYLKVSPSKPDSRCEYHSIGSLTSEGIIFCKYHGDVERLVYSEYFKDNEFDQHEKLPQNATDDEIKAKREIIIQEREKLAIHVKYKKEIFNYLQFGFYIICPILFIWLILPTRKKKRIQV
jgi:competence protein ComGC